MEPTIFRYLLKYSRREQVLLLVLTALSFPFLYFSLDLPKIIINQAIGGRDFPRELFGVELEQVEFLLVLCTAFLSLVVINGVFKYFINVYRGVVGERMLRRMRYQLFNSVLRFPIPHFRKISQGEIVSMTMAETEDLGGFIGDSIALPAFQGGTLLTILVFMFVQDPILGLAAVALYPIQAYVIPKIQRRINRLRKKRVVMVRKTSERIGEVVQGIREIHTHDTSQYELADFAERMGGIYAVRYEVYKFKFLIKFINNFLAQITPFFFYSIGGYLVINGDLSFGALVAVLAAYKDLSDPWKELLNYYQTMEDARVKYELLVENFHPPGMLSEELQETEPADRRSLLGELVASNVDLTEEEEGEATFDGRLSAKLDLPQYVAVLGGHGSGKERFAAAIAAVTRPRAGTITLNGVDVVSAPEAVTGRRIALVGQEATLRSGTVRDNLYYGLKHRPVLEVSYPEDQRKERERRRRDAILAGNSVADVNADWIDYQAIGLDGPEALEKRALEVLRSVDMDGDIYQLGLQGTLKESERPELAERILEARRALRRRLADPEIAPLVEFFDSDAYNTNMTIAENLLFGTPRDESLQADKIADNPYVRRVLEETHLTLPFLRIGREVAELMIDLFADVETGSDLFEQYSFISAEDLPVFRSLLTRISGKKDEDLEESDRRMLMSLPFKLIPARHRLGLVTDELRARILEARRVFAQGFGSEVPRVEFFDPDRYNSAISIQDNILFGKIAYGKPRAAATVGALIGEVVEELGLRVDVMEVGLDFSVGIGGARLSVAQRQKLLIARSILKHPDVLVLDEPTAVLDGGSQVTIMDNLCREFAGRALIWLVHRANLAEKFDHTLVLENGRVVEQGRFSELNRPGTVLNGLVASG